jgi:hypothetical protein
MLFVVAIVSFVVGSLASNVKSDASFHDLAGAFSTKICGGVK